jgi:hypothetical protein
LERGMTDKLITARADQMTPLEFMDTIGMSSPEKRAKRQAELRAQCIRAIEGGDLYGWPPLLVEECRQIMAVERDLRFTMELQRKDAA